MDVTDKDGKEGPFWEAWEVPVKFTMKETFWINTVSRGSNPSQFSRRHKTVVKRVKSQ